MGNCMASKSSLRDSAEVREQFVRVMRVDGKILEYKSPISVKDLLSGYEGHGVFSPGAASRPLNPEHELVPGGLYYLLPAAKCPKTSNAGSGRNDDGPNVCDEQKRPGSENSEDSCSVKNDTLKPRNETVSPGKNGVVRLKVFITKQQLAELLSNGLAKGGSVKDLLGELQAKGKIGAPHNPCEVSAANYMSNGGWRPALESIPEDGNTE